MSARAIRFQPLYPKGQECFDAKQPPDYYDYPCEDDEFIDCGIDKEDE